MTRTNDPQTDHPARAALAALPSLPCFACGRSPSSRWGWCLSCLVTRRPVAGAADAKEAEILFIPSREVRIVARGWTHPEADGETLPLPPEAMPSVAGLADDQTDIVAYETATEGTPISPPFPNTPEGHLQLVAYCAEHCTTWGYETAGAEAWAVILFGQGAAVTADGVVVANDE